jgi:hypothetical protein
MLTSEIKPQITNSIHVVGSGTAADNPAPLPAVRPKLARHVV